MQKIVSHAKARKTGRKRRMKKIAPKPVLDVNTLRTYRYAARKHGAMVSLNNLGTHLFAKHMSQPDGKFVKAWERFKLVLDEGLREGESIETFLKGEYALSFVKLRDNTEFEKMCANLGEPSYPVPDEG